MKLFFCPKCHDVVKFGTELKFGSYVFRFCKCGRSSARYMIDAVNGQIRGEAIPIGFDNASIRYALKNRPVSGPRGSYFTAFVIPKECGTIRQIGE